MNDLLNNPNFKQFEQALDLDPLIDEKFGELDINLEEISKKFQSGEIEPKKMVVPNAKVDIIQVIKSKALVSKDFELFERAHLLNNQEAIKVL